jgi:hypothetical protein
VIEKLVPSRINNDASLYEVKPGEYVLPTQNIDLFADSAGNIFRRNALGTRNIGKFNGMTANAFCVGLVFDKFSNSAFAFFVDGTDNLIFKADFNADVNLPSIARIVKSTQGVLGFYPYSKINNAIVVAGRLLYFNVKGKPPFVINIERAEGGFYDGKEEIFFTIMRRGPLLSPEISKVTVVADHYGIPNNEFQFASRFVFFDNEVSVLSVYSQPMPANKENQATPNFAINTQLSCPVDIFSLVKSVTLLVREGIDKPWRVVKDYLTSESGWGISGLNYVRTVEFVNEGLGGLLPLSESARAFDAIPRLSDSIEFIDNRMFYLESLVDYNIDESQFIFDVQYEISPYTWDDRGAKYALGNTIFPDVYQYNSNYGFGIVFFDKWGRRSPVVKRTDKIVPSGADYPNLADKNAAGPPYATHKRVTAKVSINGTPPDWAHYYVVVRSDNKTFDWAYPTKALIRFPYSTIKYTGDETNLPAHTFLEDEYLYWQIDWIVDPLNNTGIGGVGDFIDVIIPEGFPYTIDKTVVVNFTFPLDGIITLYPDEVVEIFSNKVRIKGTSGRKAAWGAAFRDFPKYYTGINLQGGQKLTDEETLMPVVFLHPKAVIDEALYDATQVYPIVNPGAPSRSFGGTPVITPKDYPVPGSSPLAEYVVQENDFLIEPVLIAPTSTAANLKIKVDFNIPNAGQYAVGNVRMKALVYKIDDTTKAPIIELASSPVFNPVHGLQTVTINASSVNLFSGWHAFGIFVEEIYVPANFQNNEFDSGLQQWDQSQDSDKAVWAAGAVVADNVVIATIGTDLALHEQSQLLSQSGLDSNSFTPIEVVASLEAYGEPQPRTGKSYQNFSPVSSDGNVDFAIAGEYEIVQPFEIAPTSFTDGQTRLTIYFESGYVQTERIQAILKIYEVDQATKRPLNVIATSSPFNASGGTLAMDIPLHQRLTAKWYGFSVLKLATPAAINFTNNSFDSGLSQWDNRQNKWTAGVSPSGDNYIEASVASGDRAEFGQSFDFTQYLTGGYVVFFEVFGPGSISVQIETNLGPLVNSQTFGPGTHNVLFPKIGGPLDTATYILFGFVGVGANASVRVYSVSTEDNLTANLRTKSTANADEQAWVRTDQNDPFIQQAFANVISISQNDWENDPPVPVELRLITDNDFNGGFQITIQPGLTPVVYNIARPNLPFSSIGFFVRESSTNPNNKKNYVSNVRIHSIRNVASVVPDVRVKTLTVANPDYSGQINQGAGWTTNAFAYDFTAVHDDVTFAANTELDVWGDSFFVAKNTLEEGKPSHSDDWAAINNYQQGAAWPQAGSRPDVIGLEYLNFAIYRRGAVNIEFRNYKEMTNGHVVVYSDVFIAEANVNGLNTVKPENKYVLDIIREPVTKLVASADRTLLAVHPSTLSSMYLRRSFNYSADGSQEQVISSKEIGEDRELSGGFGSIHPESVVSADSRNVTYGFDARKGVPWRKTLGDIQDLSLRGRTRKFFKKVSDFIMTSADPDKIRVVGAYDEYRKMYLLGFDTVTPIEEGIPARFTIGWSEFADSWLSVYTYLAESADTYYDGLISVHSSTLWRHNDEGAVNNFYGVQDHSRMTLIAPFNDRVKIFDSLAVDSENPWKIESIRIDDPMVYQSSLSENNFALKDDVWYAPFLRAENTPPEILEPNQTPRLHGHQLVGRAARITLVSDRLDRHTIQAIYLGWSAKMGHLVAATIP